MKFTVDVKELLDTTHRLKKDGTFKEFTGSHPKELLDDDFTFDDFYQAQNWKKSQKFVEVDGEKIEVNPRSSSFGDPIVRLYPHRTGKPKKNFISLEELKTVLLSGDDSIDNSLIIDFDGFLHLVPFRQAKNGPYAVRFETFLAGNGYVGNESSLNHIENTYKALLQGWEIHLGCHDMIYMDYADSTSIEETKKEILEAIEKL